MNYERFHYLFVACHVNRMCQVPMILNVLIPFFILLGLFQCMNYISTEAFVELYVAHSFRHLHLCCMDAAIKSTHASSNITKWNRICVTKIHVRQFTSTVFLMSKDNKKISQGPYIYYWTSCVKVETGIILHFMSVLCGISLSQFGAWAQLIHKATTN